MKFEHIRKFSFAAAMILAACVTALADEKPPVWMASAAKSTHATYEKDVPAVVVHEDQQVTLGADGKLVTTENYAVKLLTREGKEFAIARALYLVCAGQA
jgi:hypothetical protein